MKPETKLKRKILRELKKIPHSDWRVINQRVIRGDADIIGCCCSEHFQFEIKNTEKRGRSKREQLQRHKLLRARKAGGIGIFLTKENWREVVAALLKKAESWEPVDRADWWIKHFNYKGTL